VEQYPRRTGAEILKNKMGTQQIHISADRFDMVAFFWGPTGSCEVSCHGYQYLVSASTSLFYILAALYR